MRRLFQSPMAFVVASLIGVVISFLKGGPLGATGIALGIVGTSANLLALRAAIRMIGGASEKQAKIGFGPFIVVFLFLLKLPVLVGLGLYAQSLGGAAPGAFLAGIGLVYFALVGWAVAST